MSESEPQDVESQETPTDAESTREVSVHIDHLTKVFDDGSSDGVVAVDDLDIEIYDGEFVVFVGPSGCGKTTTLRTVAGLESPTEGAIFINGVDVTGLTPRERDISMVFQNYALYAHKTVYENIAFPLRIRRYPKDEIDDRVREVATMLDITELLERQPGELSGGQQQRVALGRALVRDSEVFLLDEPLSNLDAKLRIQMRTELNELHQRVGKTTIYVTHDQAEAMTLSDRVVVLDDGTLQQFGPPQKLYDNPKNRFVAGFIGEPPMNFFEVDVAETAEGYRASGAVIDLDLPPDVCAAIDAWDEPLEAATFGIRPEDLADVSLLGEYDEDAVVEAEVAVVEPIGSDKFLTLVDPESDDASMMTGERLEFSARVPPESDAEVGDLVTLVPNMAKTHLFDQRTGESITYDLRAD